VLLAQSSRYNCSTQNFRKTIRASGATHLLNWSQFLIHSLTSVTLVAQTSRHDCSAQNVRESIFSSGATHLPNQSRFSYQLPDIGCAACSIKKGRALRANLSRINLLIAHKESAELKSIFLSTFSHQSGCLLNHGDVSV
jgi:hypothetical protein